jgi:hypothetical protein
MDLDEDDFRQQLRKQHRRDCRTREWKAYVQEMCVKRKYRCQLCGRRGGRLTVHHRYYERGLRLWEYDDDAVELVHIGGCHLGAHADQEEEQRLHEIYDKGDYGPDLTLPPTETELRELARVEASFKGWLILNEIVPDDHDWNSERWPLYILWRQFRDEFRRETTPPRQLRLDL